MLGWLTGSQRGITRSAHSEPGDPHGSRLLVIRWLCPRREGPIVRTASPADVDARGVVNLWTTSVLSTICDVQHSRQHGRR